jgi:AbrB family looped-hinge helix DNA binding protein
MTTAKILAKGQVVIPKDVREKFQISPGDRVEVKMAKDGIILVPLRKTRTEKFQGVVRGKLSLDDLETLYAEKP